MKIPLVYPKIPDTKNFPCKNCWVWSKEDGTNVHFCYHPTLGWFAFGTRRDRFPLEKQGIADFNVAHPGLEEAPLIFQRAFSRIIGNPRFEMTLFAELVGSNSFAGMHQPGDKKTLVLFDAMIEGKLISPKDFLATFADYNPPPQYANEVAMPRLLYTGKYSGQLVEDIRKGKFGVKEGAVIKGVDKDGNVHMAKVKTEQYMKRLQEEFKDEWQNYWE